MTKDQMMMSTEILFDAFHVPNKEGKLRALYTFFGGEDPILVQKACRTLVSEEDRFPTVSRFGDVLRQIKQQSPAQINKIECKYCRSDGFVVADHEDKKTSVYRCYCANGSKFPSYPEWFGLQHPGKILRVDMNQDVVNNSELYRKGLAYLNRHGIKMPQSAKAEIERLIAEGEGDRPW